MPDSDIQITAGSGTKVDTRTVGTGSDEHRQVIVVGDPTTASAVAGVTAANGLAVDVTRVTGSVTVAQATASSLNAQVVGEVADDSPDSGNPVKIGAFAESNPSTSVMVGDGDRTNVHADIDGLLMTKPFTAYGDILVERVTNTDGASTASVVFGATASARNMITSIAVYNSSTTNGFVDIRDGTAGTVLFTIPAPANGGSIINFPLPLRQTTANTALAYDVSAALSTIYISFIGFKSRV